MQDEIGMCKNENVKEMRGQNRSG